MKTTKEQLVKENSQLRERLGVSEKQDTILRENLTEILNYYKSNTCNGFNSPRIKTMSWLDIVFHIGELRADANYSCLLESREEMRREIERLRALASDEKQ